MNQNEFPLTEKEIRDICKLWDLDYRAFWFGAWYALALLIAAKTPEGVPHFSQEDRKYFGNWRQSMPGWPLRPSDSH